MKIISTIFLIAFLLSTAISCSEDKEKNTRSFHSEVINDSIFENVYLINDNHIVSDGNNYLFDFSIPKTVELPVIFVQSDIPLNLLPSLYPEFPRLIVISPNWPFYDEFTSSHIDSQATCAEPTASSIVYEFNRESGKLLKDSLIIMGGFPEMKISQNRNLKKNEKKIFYTESYGSNCCPKDIQWDNHPTREEFISLFQDKNKCKVKGTYKEATGNEGEAKYFYTLKGLSNPLKLKFITERNFYRIINRQNKDTLIPPKIYTPTLIEINNSMKRI